MAVKGIDDLDKIIRTLGAMKKHLPAIAGAAVYAEANDIMRVSVREVPVDTGRLRSTAFVSLPTKTRNPRVRIGYGTDYAIYVHERIEISHSPPTKAKFLSDPLERAKRGMTQRVGDDIMRRLRTLNTAISNQQFPTRPVKTEKQS